MYEIYEIKRGESLNDIAYNLGVSVEELKMLNGINDIIDSNYIIVPKKNIYKKYIVKDGDTLYKIARENNINYETLMKINGLKNNEYIYKNQELLIPTSNMYVTGREKIKDVINKLNVDLKNIEDLYLAEDQIITY